MAALQVLQHVRVCGLNAGRVHVTHQGPEEQQVQGTEPSAGCSLPHSGSARAGPVPVRPPPSRPSLPVVPTRQAKAMCCRADLWSGRLASISVSPRAARRVKARQVASLTCVRLRAGWGLLGRWGPPEGPPLGGPGVPGELGTWDSEGGPPRPLRWDTGGWGPHSLVEEQQVGGVEFEVVLEAVPSGQVGQAAELGKAVACRGLGQTGAHSPRLSAVLPSPLAWGPPCRSGLCPWTPCGLPFSGGVRASLKAPHPPRLSMAQ